jgi:hypothetical protein
MAKPVGTTPGDSADAGRVCAAGPGVGIGRANRRAEEHGTAYTVSPMHRPTRHETEHGAGITSAQPSGLRLWLWSRARRDALHLWSESRPDCIRFAA